MDDVKGSAIYVQEQEIAKMNPTTIPTGNSIVPFMYVMLGLIAVGLILYTLYMLSKKG
jgi:hypothetical protein